MTKGGRCGTRRPSMWEDEMKPWICASVFVLLPISGMAADAPPDWAYPVAPANFQLPPDNGQAKHVQGSPLAFTQKDVENSFGPQVWFSNDHAPILHLVVHGNDP